MKAVTIFLALLSVFMFVVSSIGFVAIVASGSGNMTNMSVMLLFTIMVMIATLLARVFSD